MDLRVIYLTLQTLLYVSPVSSETKYASHQCLEVAGEPDIVRIVFRILKNDDPIFKVYAFGATTLDTSTTANRETNAACIKDTTTDPIVYDITVTTTAASHDCGIAVYDEGGVSVAVFLVRVYAYDDTMLDADDDSFVIRCSMDDLDPTIISTPKVDFSDDTIINVVPPQFGAYLRVLDPDDLKPVFVASLGQAVKLSAEFYPELSLGPDNYGTHFFVGFLSNDPLAADITSASELYIVIQPRYSYRTDITVTTIDGSETYVSEDGTSHVVTFDAEYMGCSEDGTPEIADIGIEIYSHPMEIGVLVCNFETATADCYTALPTDVTGTEYYATSMMTANEPAEFLIVAQTDATEVVIDIPADSTHTDAGGTVTIVLDKLEAYHYAVNTTDPDTAHVNGYHFVANESISVISGNLKYSADHMSTQVPPVNRFGKHYVLVSVDLANDGHPTRYILQALTPDVQTTVTQYLSDTTTQDYVLTTTTYPQQAIDIPSGSHCELIADYPIMVSQVVYLNPTDGVESTLLIMPSVEQWSPKYTLDFGKSGFLVTTILVFKSNSDVSQFLVNGGTINFSSTSDVTGPNGYVLGAFSIPSHIRFRIQLGDEITTMMALCYVTSGNTISTSDVVIGFPAHGLRYLTKCEKPTIGRRGDGVDNDCDGLIDEEIADLIDNDGDDMTDEDTIALTEELVGAVGVRVINCRVSGDPAFPDGFVKYITDGDGCAVTGSGSFISGGEFGPSPVNTGIDPKYLRIGPLRLGMFLDSSELHFVCDIEKYCTDASDTDCTTICQPSTTKRKKRQIDDSSKNNVTTSVYIFPYTRNNDQTYSNVSLTKTSLIDCMDNTYIQVMIGFLSAVALISFFTAICFSCYIRRKKKREKKPKRPLNFDWFPNKLY
ncbi:hypothetical protein ACF0H5_004890 [Mactra antiquata]